MSDTWRGAPPPPATRLGPAGIARALGRGLPLSVVVFAGLAVLLALRLVERPLFGARRPWTPYITCAVCRAALRLIGLGYRREGAPLAGEGVQVANHVSWIDIFALNAAAPLYFVSKAEVAGWPGIGWLARATGTVFIRRDRRREAPAQVALLARRLSVGHRLLFFPEGTSTDGRRVLPFKTTLFAAVLAAASGRSVAVQPVTLVYMAPEGADPTFYGWWGDMAFGPHFLSVLAAPRQGSVRVIYHPPIAVAGVDRKALAARLESTVRAGLG